MRDLFLQNKETVIAIFVFLYEVFARVTPTGGTISIITFIYRLICFIIPDKKTDGTTHDVKKNDTPKN